MALKASKPVTVADVDTAKLYRLVAGTHGRAESGKNVRYLRGSKIVLTDREAARFVPGRLELIDSHRHDHPAAVASKPSPHAHDRVTVGPAGKATADTTEEPYDWSEVLAGKAPAIIAYIAGLDVDDDIVDITGLPQLIEQEQARAKPRSAVIDAARAKIEEAEAE